MNESENIKILEDKLHSLLKKQNYFFSQIKELREEIHKFKMSAAQEHENVESEPPAIAKPDKPAFKGLQVVDENRESETTSSIENEARTQDASATNRVVQPEPIQKKPLPTRTKGRSSIEWEKFIGENLINKIGIAILVIGVGIGAKYAIDHDLISPLTRIILGYFLGFALLAFAAKLKSTIENFSAVLLSGAMATMYLVTLAAYDSYQLIPQGLAFGIMAILTAFTVLAALKYNREVIAIIGLVGAYAVPYLLSDGSGNVVVLMGYTAIINIGIMVLAVKKYWKTLYYSAFVLTTLIYVSWFAIDYNEAEHFRLAFIFLAVFFFTFYATFIAYKLIQKEKFQLLDIILVLINSFIFYGIGYVILHNHETGSQMLGLFTVANAIIHFGVSMVVYRQKLADKNLFYLIARLVLVFITIAIPVQLDGHWVTSLWAGEAALLFWIGRTKKVGIYEILSYPVMFIASLSLLQDWQFNYSSINSLSDLQSLTPIFNVNFLGSVLFIAAIGFINKINLNKDYKSAFFLNPSLRRGISYALPGVLIASIYGAFQVEIKNYWQQVYENSYVEQLGTGAYNTDIPHLEILWVLIYSLLFVSILSFVNHKKIKNHSLSILNIVLISVAILAFMTEGLDSLNQLRNNYLDEYLSEYFVRSSSILSFRYLCYAFVGLALYAFFQLSKEKQISSKLGMYFDIALHLSILIFVSDELFHWLNIYKAEDSFDITLSILWGLYALALILFGIRNGKKYLRIGGIGLFGVTLIKVFTYDISNMESGAKTIVLISLGVLLLVISFLYNKYKNIIIDEPED